MAKDYRLASQNVLVELQLVEDKKSAAPTLSGNGRATLMQFIASIKGELQFGDIFFRNQRRTHCCSA